MTSFRGPKGANGNLVFLDTETGGLDPDSDELVEVSYAVNEADIVTLILPHRPWRIGVEAAATNQYHQRRLSDTTLWASAHDRTKLLDVLTGSTLICANPAFDSAFLRRHYEWQPWHHRMADVEAMAWALGIAKDDGTMPGLLDIVQHLNAKGYAVPTPDHTARGDVDALRTAFYSLISLGATQRSHRPAAQAWS